MILKIVFALFLKDVMSQQKSFDGITIRIKSQNNDYFTIYNNTKLIQTFDPINYQNQQTCREAPI
jgi:hypothetical protein